MGKERREFDLEGRRITLYGPADARFVLIQPADTHDLSEMEEEVHAIAETAGTESFLLAAVEVKDWNGELSPWEAPPVFGSEGFGSGAGEMLSYIRETLLPRLAGMRESAAAAADADNVDDAAAPREEKGGVKTFLGGYSLAGFFALWSAYQTADFDGAAAVSPSVWFPGWTDYAAAHSCRAPMVYLSLGDKEERARNRTMARVGDAIREQYRRLSGEERIPAVLEWNPGNHFRDAGLRTAKGFSWLILQTIQRDGTSSERASTR